MHTYIYDISIVHAGGPEGAGDWQPYSNIVLLTHTLPYGHGRSFNIAKRGGKGRHAGGGGVLMTSRLGILF